jgi:dCMP deaminase
MTRSKWDKRFIELAAHVATWSKDPSTKCGSLVAKDKRIVSLGFNGFPAGVNDDEDRYNDRELKLQLILHAESNALLFAKEPLDGCTIYVWPFPPCCRCAAQIIQSGIRRVVAPAATGDRGDRWAKELEIASDMYADAGVELVTFSVRKSKTVLPFTVDTGRGNK